MIETEVLIVGGGPAGATCADALRRRGIDCLILDRAMFPRLKLCAGWVPPQVFADLGIDPAEYPHGLRTFRRLHVSVRGIGFPVPTLQYAIRRYEFDAWLLRRSGAPVQMHHVRSIVREGDRYIVDGTYAGTYLVGAGGTNCPVARTFFRQANERSSAALIVTQEEEFPYEVEDERCYLWFLEDGLPGYAWYVPKAGGYVNVGVGGKAEGLRSHGDTITRHWDRLVDKLTRRGLVRDHDFHPDGYAYYLREPSRTLRIDNAFIVGDAAGLATVDMGEGIEPAVRSGSLAAAAIADGTDYELDAIRSRSLQISALRLLR